MMLHNVRGNGMKRKMREFLSFLWEKEDAPINSVMEYRQRAKRQKRKTFLKTVVIAAAVAAAVFALKHTIDNWTYSGYEVITDVIQEEESLAEYTEFGENLLKYGGDEIALLNRQQEVLWSYQETMNYPEAEVCEDVCLVYDRKGTSCLVFDLDGKIGTIQTTMPIVKAKTAKQGVVAAILEEGDTTWINVYNAKGDILVTCKTGMEDPGYPVDLALSSDGLLLAVSYVNVENHKINSCITFYQFGNAGQNQIDNIVASFTCEDMLIPDVEYLDDTYAAAFGEDGFCLYKGRQIPEEQTRVTVEESIVSVFCDESYIGLIVRTENADSPYRMDLYHRSGEKAWSAAVESLFEEVKISQNEILLCSSTNFAIYSMKGVCRYQGTITQGAMRGLFKLARNRYLAVLDNGTEIFKLV